MPNNIILTGFRGGSAEQQQATARMAEINDALPLTAGVMLGWTVLLWTFLIWRRVQDIW